MKLKISDVLEVGKPVENNGKTYYSWLVSGRIEGESADRKLIELKSTQNLTLSSGQDIEINPGKEYQGKTPYWIKPQGLYQGKSRPSYTLEEYNALWEYTMKRFGNIKESQAQQAYRSTYLITASNLGIKIPSGTEQVKDDDFWKDAGFEEPNN